LKISHAERCQAVALIPPGNLLGIAGYTLADPEANQRPFRSFSIHPFTVDFLTPCED
jgi:hypothetical protein